MKKAESGTISAEAVEKDEVVDDAKRVLSTMS